MAVKTKSKTPHRSVAKPKEPAPKESKVRKSPRRGKKSPADNKAATTTVKEVKRSKRAVKRTREEAPAAGGANLEHDIIIIERPIRLTGEAEQAKRDDPKVNKARPEGRLEPGQARS